MGLPFATTNEIVISYAPESTAGTVPAVAFQKLRASGETLDANLTFVTSKEFRADRQVPSQIVTDAKPGGDVTVELSYGVADDLFAASIQGTWSTNLTTNTAAAVAAHSITVTAGGLSFTNYMLLYGTGWTTAANNILVHVTTSTATTITVTETVVSEASGAGKQYKYFGIEAPVGDVVATVAVGTIATLTTTLVDWTKFNLSVGQWIRLGGSNATNKFATAANNAFVRITAIAAGTLTIDNLPTGWAADTGVGKLIRIQVGEYVRNGVAIANFSVQREHTDKNLFFVFKGMQVEQNVITLQAGQITNAKITFKGLGYAVNTVNYGTGADLAAPTGTVLNGVNNAIAIWEGNAQTANYTKTVTLTVKNNLRDQTAVGTLGNVGIGDGQFNATVALDIYLQDLSLVNKFYNFTATSFGFAQQDAAGNTYIFYLPSALITAGKVNAAAVNQDVMFAITASAQIDTLTNSMCQQDRFVAVSGF